MEHLSRRTGNTRWSLTCLGLLAAGAVPLAAQTPPAAAAATAPATPSPKAAAPAEAVKPAPPAPTFINGLLREQAEFFNPFDIGGQVRVRPEYREHFAVAGNGPRAVDFNASSPVPINDYLVSRERFHVGYTPASWITVYGEGQNSADFGDQRNPSPDEDAGFNLRQAYVNAGDLKKFPLLLKVGRQELSYGDERLIGAFDWNNIGRVFDAVKLRYEQSDLWVDGFTSHLVIPTESEWNEPNRDEFFSGVYASTRSLVPKVETQAYFLAQNANADSPSLKGDAGVNGDSPRDVYTVGFRVKSLPGQWSGWDYQAEFAGQFGNFEYLPNTPTVVNGARLNQGAYAGYVAGGYTFEKTWATPRIGLEFNYASGDTDPTDNRHGTFVNLYPTNHRFYGYMDFVSWQNIINPRLQVSAQPLKALRLSVDYNLFWLAQTEDFFYQVNQAPRTTGGYGIRPGNDSFAGQEIDVVARYTISPAALLEAGYGHFFVGPYVKESLANTGGAVDANWFYMQFTLNF